MQTATMTRDPETTLTLDVTLPLDRERAFALWSDAEHLARWWGPKDGKGRPMRAGEIEWSPSEDARWRVVLVPSEGQRFVQSGRFVSVRPPEVLSSTFAWEDDNGKRGEDTLIEVAFEATGDGTRVTLRQTGFPDAKTRDGHAEGWRECLDRLVEEARR